jgi:hypothetical protein
MPIPGFYTSKIYQDLIQKTLLAEIKRSSNRNKLKNKKYVCSKKTNPKTKNYVKNQASKNIGIFEKYKEGDTGSTLFLVLTA